MPWNFWLGFFFFFLAKNGNTGSCLVFLLIGDFGTFGS